MPITRLTHRLSRRTLLGGAASGAAAMLLAACAGPTPTATPQPAKPAAAEPTKPAAAPAAAEPTKPAAAPAAAKVEPTKPAAAPAAAAKPASGEKIRVVHWGWSPDVEYKALLSATQPYIDSHPNIDLKYEVFPQDYDSKLVAALAAGQGPDVFWVNTEPRLRQLQATNQLAQLDPLVKGQNMDLSVFSPAMIERMRIGGNLFAFPFGWANFTLAYNKDLFAKAGVPEPTDKWTLTDLREAAKKLTIREGNRVTQYGLALDVGNLTWPWSIGNGGGILDNMDNPTKSMFTHPKTEEIAQFVRDVYQTDKTVPAPEAARELGGSTGGFQSGRIAMWVPYGMWASSSMRTNKNLRFDVQHMPLLPSGKRAGYLICSPMAMNAKTAHPNEAFEYLRFHTTDPGINKYVAEFLYGAPVISVHKEVYAPDRWKMDPQNIQRFVDALDYSIFGPLWPGWTQFSAEVLRPANDALANGQGSVKSILDDAQAKGDANIKNWK